MLGKSFMSRKPSRRPCPVIDFGIFVFDYRKVCVLVTLANFSEIN